MVSSSDLLTREDYHLVHEAMQIIVLHKDGQQRLHFPFHYRGDGQRGYIYASIDQREPVLEQLESTAWVKIERVSMDTFSAWCLLFDRILIIEL